jgi:preprotein translocase subunit SecA
VYSSPELGSDSPAVQTSEPGDDGPAKSATARRQQQARSNPNRGSRGNRKSKSGAKPNKRKR